MELSSLINEYRSCEKALYNAIKSEKIAAIREYDIRMNWLRNVIRDFTAPTVEERMQQVCFFMESISQASDINPHSALFFDVGTIIKRYVAEEPTTGRKTAAGRAAKPAGANGSNAISDPGATGDALARIEKSDLRISTFDTEFRYTYTSPANCRFHDAPPDAFIGRHVAEIIGNERFEKRAKGYFEKCLAGENQCYYYYLDGEKRGRQLLECQMLRQHGRGKNAPGAVVIVRDVTDRVVDPVRSAEENRV